MGAPIDKAFASEVEAELVSRLRLTFEGYESTWKAESRTVSWLSFEIVGSFPRSELVVKFSDDTNVYEYHERLWDERSLPSLEDVSAEAFLESITDIFREGLGSQWRRGTDGALVSRIE